MPSIGKMAAQMTLDSQQFTTGLQTAGQGLNKFSAETKSAFDGVSRTAEASAKSMAMFNETAPEASKGWKVKDIKNLVKSVASAGIIMQEFADDGSKAGKAIADIGGTLALTAINPVLGIAFGMKKAVDWIKEGHKESEKLTAALKEADQAAQAIGVSRLSGLDRARAEYQQSIEPILRARRLAVEEGMTVEQARRRIALPEFENPDRRLNQMREEFDIQRRLVGLTQEMAQIYRTINEGASPQAVRLAAMALDARNVAQMIQQIRQQRDLSGLTPVQRVAAMIPEGATPAQEREIIRIARDEQRRLRADMIASERAKVEDQNLSPLERFQQEIRRLRRLGLTDRDFNLAQSRAFDVLQGSLGRPGGVSPTAAQAGSQAAANAIIRSENMAATQQDALGVLRESRELMRRLVQRADEQADRLRNVGPVAIFTDEND